MTTTTAGWHASIDLHFRRDGARTTMTKRHLGPLQVQKALFPEGGECCHAILLHPPGGIAGGDKLAIDVRVENGAHALITTPGAARWYKSAGRPAAQSVRLRVEGALEWLPQEAIVFDAAEVDSSLQLELETGAATLGWDIVALGRTACGERYTRGCFAQSISLKLGGELQWLERTRIAGGDRLLDSPVGLDGRPVFGCFWACGPAWSDHQVDALRIDRPDAALTRVAPHLLVARALGSTTAAVRAVLESLWARTRPLVLGGRAAMAPRIWAT